MQKTFWIALGTLILALPAIAADVNGSWNVTGDVVGNPLNMKCNLVQTDTKLSGACSGPAGASPITGTVSGARVTFQHNVQADQVYELTFTGTLKEDGNSFSGDIAVAGVTGTFTATKDKAPETAADISGSWTITGDVVGNAINMKCTLKRDGDKLAGDCLYQGIGNSSTTGSVAGDTVTLSNHADRDGIGYDLTYTGKLDATATAVTGSIAVKSADGPFSGQFSARKDK